MRRYYLVCYDICDPKRLQKTHKILSGYGEAWQYSVFFCYLKAIDRVRLQTRLEETVNLKEDQVLIIDLGENAGVARGATTTIGRALPETPSGMLVT